MKFGKLCFDLSLLSQGLFQLASQSEHVNCLKPVSGCLDSPVSFILTAAEIEQLKCGSSGGSHCGRGLGNDR
ncbi:hypothetical protein RN69_22845 [Bradyrhizobium japonicum]|nr:hypothetical protein RN69_22845 [Bradyrhizobium japonicum]